VVRGADDAVQGVDELAVAPHRHPLTRGHLLDPAGEAVVGVVQPEPKHEGDVHTNRAFTVAVPRSLPICSVRATGFASPGSDPLGPIPSADQVPVFGANTSTDTKPGPPLRT
jgi:hypothetical protein